MDDDGVHHHVPVLRCILEKGGRGACQSCLVCWRSRGGALNENSGGLRTALKRMFNRFAEEESGPHMRQHLEFMCF